MRAACQPAALGSDKGARESSVRKHAHKRAIRTGTFRIFAGTSDATLLDRGAPHACALSREFVLLRQECRIAAEHAFARQKLVELRLAARDLLTAHPGYPAVRVQVRCGVDPPPAVTRQGCAARMRPQP